MYFYSFYQFEYSLILSFKFQKIEPSAIEDFYGLTTDIQKSSETGYILFYQSRDSSSAWIKGDDDTKSEKNYRKKLI